VLCAATIRPFKYHIRLYRLCFIPTNNIGLHYSAYLVDILGFEMLTETIQVLNFLEFMIMAPTSECFSMERF
jgi:hypothetical protein